MKRKSILFISIATAAILATIYFIQPNQILHETNPKIYEGIIAKHLSENKSIRDRINQYIKAMTFDLADINQHIRTLKTYALQLNRSMQSFKRVEYTGIQGIPQMTTYYLLFEKYEELALTLELMISELEEDNVIGAKQKSYSIREINKQLLKLESIFYYYEIE